MLLDAASADLEALDEQEYDARRAARAQGQLYSSHCYAPETQARRALTNEACSRMGSLLGTGVGHLRLLEQSSRPLPMALEDIVLALKGCSRS